MNLTAYRALWANRQYRIASDERGGPASTEYRLWGLATPLGFDPFLPRAYHDFIEQWVGFDNNRDFRLDVRNQEMLRELGVRYVITHQGAANADWLADNPAFRLLGPDDSFYRVYEYAGARDPYGWAEAGGSGDRARPIEWLPERRVFEVGSDEGGRFFLGENFLPGWHAAVDGRAAPLERWDRVFQAVRVGPGRHTVAFEYTAPGLWAGAAVSLATAAAMALVRIRGERHHAACKPR